MAVTREKIIAKYAKKLDSIPPPIIKTELELLRHFAGNYIEAAWQCYSKICALSIPEAHKEIAWQILNEEKAIILAEFHAAYEEL